MTLTAMRRANVHTASKFVAASDAPVLERVFADYICDGVADDVQIAAAYSDLGPASSLTNAGAEDGDTTGWTGGTGVTLTANTAAAQNGTYGFKIVTDGARADNAELMYQDLDSYTSWQGKTIFLIVWLSRYSGAKGVKAQINDGVSTTSSAAITSSTPTRVLVKHVVDSAATRVRIRILLNGAESAANTFYIDEFATWGTGGRIQLSSGRFLTAAVINPAANITLEGQGKGKSIIQITGVNSNVFTLPVNTHYTGFKNLTIHGDKTNAPSKDGLSIYNPCHFGVVENVEFMETGDDGIDTGNQPVLGANVANQHWSFKGLSFVNCGGASMSANHNEFCSYEDFDTLDTSGIGSYTGDGFVWDGCRNITISHFQVYGVGGHGLRWFKNTDVLGSNRFCKDVVVNDCVVDTNGWDSAAKDCFKLDHVTELTASNLVGKNCQNYGVRETSGSDNNIIDGSCHFYDNFSGNMLLVGANTIRLSTEDRVYIATNISAAGTSVRAAITATGSAQEITSSITNPDIPRVVRISHTDGSGTGNGGGKTITIYGTDTNDRTVSNAILTTLGTTTVGVVAFKTVTQIDVPANLPTNDTVAVQLDRPIGLPDAFIAQSDVYFVERAAASTALVPEAVGTVSIANRTVYQSGLSGAETLRIHYHAIKARTWDT